MSNLTCGEFPEVAPVSDAPQSLFDHTSWLISLQEVSTLLKQKMTDGHYECSFTVGSQKYRVNFTTMTQTNITTGSQREVRLRPAYRSPESMRPYLQLVLAIVSMSVLFCFEVEKHLGSLDSVSNILSNRNLICYFISYIQKDVPFLNFGTFTTTNIQQKMHILSFHFLCAHT